MVGCCLICSIPCSSQLLPLPLWISWCEIGHPESLGVLVLCFWRLRWGWWARNLINEKKPSHVEAMQTQILHSIILSHLENVEWTKHGWIVSYVTTGVVMKLIYCRGLYWWAGGSSCVLEWSLAGCSGSVRGVAGSFSVYQYSTGSLSS